jgi:hypothetical protein
MLVLLQTLVPRMHLAPVPDFQMLELLELQTPPVLGQVRQSHQRQWQALEPLQSHLSPVPKGHQTNRQRERLLGLQNHRELQTHRLVLLPFLYSLDYNLQILILRNICYHIVAWPKWNAM